MDLVAEIILLALILKAVHRPVRHVAAWAWTGDPRQRELALNQTYNAAVVRSQGLNVDLYGGSPDISISGEIGRRERDGAPLDPFLTLVSAAIGAALGRDHFALSIEQDETGHDSASLRTERV